MSVFEYNGSAIVAMVGKNCFAIASDRRLGVNLQTVATDFQRIYKIHDKLFVGLSGLGTDAQTLYQRLVFRHKLYQLREERDMKPETFASLVSAILYEKRFGPYFCQPVIAGLGDDSKPFICTMDFIGAKELAKDFVVAGSASESLYGACEALFKPDMEPDELFEVVSQALLASVDRDCLSGWGGHIYIVTPDEPGWVGGLTIQSHQMVGYFHEFERRDVPVPFLFLHLYPEAGKAHSLIFAYGPAVELEAFEASSVCKSTWDFICYIENFCVANLLKMVIVLALFYIVLLFFYLFYKMGICECIGHIFCKMAWLCLVAWFSMWEYCCIFICDKLIMLKRIRHGHRIDLSEFDTSEEDYDYVPRTMEISGTLSRRTRDYRIVHLSKSLRPRSHRIRVGLGSAFDCGCERILRVKHGKHVSTVKNIRVTHTSQFVRKGSSFRGRAFRRQWR
ncbi:unnamed protein product [Dovyalis caffra]|uniref:Proteasome subunit beta type-3 n=1 Tax=Dovyalis caffra TaxID=77055 RepID=A0AAV1S9M7_9ROSI|nr:unnamed protein product [Dovyalis caffra]